ncbi:MAG: 30S ribosomal protein S16 [Planctomycetaceae bacterium]|nr:MAG: 30S ribosomal protein S16 [Planctomycetaceae bacterium]
MAVRIRLKRLGRRHRPFFRICAMDSRAPRDGRAIEELGHYDPMVRETDARAVLNAERIDYWLGVGALPTEKVAVLIKKYGTNGTHLEKQREAQERLAATKPMAPPPMVVTRKQEEPPASEEAAEPEAATTEAVEPEVAATEAVEPEVAATEAVEPEAAATEAAEPEADETKAARAEAGETPAAEAGGEPADAPPEP